MGYAGGLALAFVTGFWASQAVARELGLSLPRLPDADSRDVVSDKEPVVMSRL